jgi:hypothetical protein
MDPQRRQEAVAHMTPAERRLLRLIADSGHPDQPIRPIVITCTGDRDHAARLC